MNSLTFVLPELSDSDRPFPLEGLRSRFPFSTFSSPISFVTGAGVNFKFDRMVDVLEEMGLIKLKPGSFPPDDESVFGIDGVSFSTDTI